MNKSTKEIQSSDSANGLQGLTGPTKYMNNDL